MYHGYTTDWEHIDIYNTENLISVIGKDNYETVILLPSRNINCVINLYLIVWQSELVDSTEGFTDREVVKYQIAF